MSTEKTHFRTALSGFNKADVLEYLDKLNADFREENRRGAAALEEKSRLADELSAEAESLKASLAEAKAAADEAAAKAAKLEEELAGAKQALSESEAVIASQTELIDSLQHSAAERVSDGGEKAEAERKAELYDGVSSQLGDILIAANKNAEDITEAANVKARELIDGAAADAAEARNTFAAAMDECTAAFASEAEKISAGCCGDINAELGRIREAVDRALLQLQKASLCISEKTQQAKSSLDAELKTSLESLDKKIAEIRNGK